MTGRTSNLITVAICTRNRSAFLEKAIRSVVPQLTPDTELLVVDNASTDDTRQVCERLAQEIGGVTYLLEPKLGLSAARNRALTHSNSEYVLFVDDDAIADPGWLAAYRNFLLNPLTSKIAVVGGAVVSLYDRPPPKWISPEHSGFNLGEKPLRLPGGGLIGCNSAYCRKATLAVGSFDERLGYKGNTFINREESELQDRLVRAGWECWWLPGAGVQHHVAAARLTIRGQVNSTFNAGRAAAIHRLKVTTARHRRVGLRSGRLLIAPFHILINYVQAVVLFAMGRQKPAVGALCRASRAAGWAWQVLNP